MPRLSLALLSSSLIIAVSSFFIFLHFHKPDSAPKSTWQTYTNTQWAFSISYPPEWYQAENRFHSQQNGLFLMFDSVPIPEPDSTNPLTHGWRNLALRISKGYLEPRQGRVFQFFGQKAYISFETQENPLGDSPKTYITFTRNGHNWLIYYPNTDYTGKHDPLYDLILSTFKFSE